MSRQSDRHVAGSHITGDSFSSALLSLGYHGWMCSYQWKKTEGLSSWDFNANQTTRFEFPSISFFLVRVSL